MLITTGSQGEPLSALSRMAQASHRQVKVGPNDFIIISARPIPGNEKTVTKVVNGLPTSFQFRPGPTKCSPCAALLHIHTKQPFKILQKLLFL